MTEERDKPNAQASPSSWLSLAGVGQGRGVGGQLNLSGTQRAPEARGPAGAKTRRRTEEQEGLGQGSCVWDSSRDLTLAVFSKVGLGSPQAICPRVPPREAHVGLR